MPGERCSTCGTARAGSFRYCLKCGFDFDLRTADRAVPEPAVPQEAQPATLTVTQPPVLRDAQPAATAVAPSVPREVQPVAIAVAPPLVAVGPAAAASATVSPSPCPYLGLVEDAETTFMFAAPGHRCRADSMPVKIALPHQGTYCLSGEYRTCPRFPTSNTKRVEPVRTPSPEPASPPGVRGHLRPRSIVSLVMAILLAFAAIWVIGTRVVAPTFVPGSSPAASPRLAPSAPAQPTTAN